MRTILPSRQFVARVATVLFAGAETTSFVTTRCERLKLAFEGIAGDRHFGFLRGADARTPHYRRGLPIRNIRQISIVSVEELAQIAARLDLPEMLPEWLGANLVIEGLPNLSFLPRGTRLAFLSGAALACEGYNPPCIGPGRKVHEHAPRVSPQAFVKAAARRRGIVASVESAGLLEAGNEVHVHVPEQWVYE